MPTSKVIVFITKHHCADSSLPIYKLYECLGLLVLFDRGVVVIIIRKFKMIFSFLGRLGYDLLESQGELDASSLKMAPDCLANLRGDRVRTCGDGETSLSERARQSRASMFS